MTNPHLSAMEAFALGAFAKATSTAITYPIVTLKSRKQAGKTSGMQGEEEVSPVKKVLDLYRGLRSALVHKVVQAALLYMFKDQIADFVVHLFSMDAKQAGIMLRNSGRKLKLRPLRGKPLAS
mmetsp:Transcript_3819/g.5887  ORF Transcript_3819/g.5887 Transcript_3819/m.5887 type:complete len:123 (-) Transcript_3819:146-514(-)